MCSTPREKMLLIFSKEEDKAFDFKQHSFFWGKNAKKSNLGSEFFDLIKVCLKSPWQIFHPVEHL
jgi:hypothetical protein